jgi:hypothetical protein
MSNKKITMHLQGTKKESSVEAHGGLNSLPSDIKVVQ